MHRIAISFLFTIASAFALNGTASAADKADAGHKFARDPKQPVDTAYTKKIAEYTTDPRFNSPLTDYLPASSTAPTPEKALGYIAGAPNHLPYTKQVEHYFDLLATASPRVKVFRIGKSEEGREMIAVAIADASLIAKLKANNTRLAQLADPRKIGMDDARADALITRTTPVYYITGTIHSPETGAPTALMELAYRLAVDDAPYIRHIRSHVITLITPVVETDGRDRMVDLYNWHLANPGKTPPPLIYWGHYVAHDNNRDAMGLTLNLTRHVLDTYLGWHAQVLHDLHESVPFLYDNTVGDGPYNAWVDPILVNEWQMLGWDNVQQMTKFGMPGVFTHGAFDTWSPGYLMSLAAMHNGISRLYETFGNGGADTVERILDPDEYARTWYRPNPPLPKVLWSQRDNNNYEQTGLLTALDYFADNAQQFLHNFYLKSKRSIDKPQLGGPAAYVFPGDDVHRDAQAGLLRVLQHQHVEISRADAVFTVQAPVTPGHSDDDPDKNSAEAEPEKPQTAAKSYPAGSYIVRMDQPYSRVADVLLDRQYWSPGDPQKHPYDDTGWTFGPLFGIEVVRITDPAVLKVPVEAVRDPVDADGGIHGSGDIYLLANHADASLMSLRYAFKGAKVSIADKAFDAANRHFEAGTWIVHGVRHGDLAKQLDRFGLDAWAVDTRPAVASHRIGAPRIALMHTWLRTQTEGWWRMALDKLHVPYEYISTQTVAREDRLRRKYDVILFAPVGTRNTQLILNGLPDWYNPMPWKTTRLTPNIGKIDSTDDIRPGLGGTGLEHLRQFVRQGGVLITSEDTAKFAIDMGLAPGVSIADRKGLKVVGSILDAAITAPTNPVSYGYDKRFAVYSAQGMSFELSNVLGGDNLPVAKDYQRPTGRGGSDDTDQPEARPPVQPPELPAPKRWQATPLNSDQQRPNPFFPYTVIPADQRPQTVVRFAEADDLLVSGLLKDGGAMANRAAVVDARFGKGHTVLFAINPIWRGETIGSYALVFNAILNFSQP